MNAREENLNVTQMLEGQRLVQGHSDLVSCYRVYLADFCLPCGISCRCDDYLVVLLPVHLVIKGDGSRPCRRRGCQGRPGETHIFAVKVKATKYTYAKL